VLVEGPTEQVDDVLEVSPATTPSVGRDEEASLEYSESQLRPNDHFGVPSDLLAHLPGLRPLPIHDLEGLIEPGVAYGVDEQQRLHLVVLGADVTALAIAEKRLDMRMNESVLNAVLEKTEVGRLAPFNSGGLQRDILLPESDAAATARLHRGRFNIHLLIESVPAMPRVVPLDLC
jgi:hypothetical protein